MWRQASKQTIVELLDDPPFVEIDESSQLPAYYQIIKYIFTQKWVEKLKTHLRFEDERRKNQSQIDKITSRGLKPTNNPSPNDSRAGNNGNLKRTVKLTNKVRRKNKMTKPIHIILD